MTEHTKNSRQPSLRDVEDVAVRIRELLAARAPVHMLGICGVGMAGLARLLSLRGVPVSGCDSSVGDTADWLAGLGIPVRRGHDPAHLASDVRWVIRSTAVAVDAPELATARARGLVCVQRGQVLPILLEGRTSVAVCGTHGKSTTTTLLTWILWHAGRDPAWCIGATSPNLPGLADDRGGVLVVEADESDGTLAAYAPDYTVLTNVDFDHMEHFADEDAFEECFSQVIRRTGKALIVCADDPRAMALSRTARRRIAYGFGTTADVHVTDAVETPDSASFTLSRDGVRLGRIRIPVPGRHNIGNAAGAAAAALALGVSFEGVRDALAVAALPRRRFELVAAVGDIRVVSDYAHHPAEIAALVAMSRTVGPRRLRAVFQPHRYTRTRALCAAFPPAFRGVDEVVLLPVYPASEAPLEGGQTWDLYGAFRAQGGLRVTLAEDREQVWDYMAHTLRPGDMLLVVGAGNVVSIAESARAAASHGAFPTTRPAFPADLLSPASRCAYDHPLGAHTTFGVGGRADAWVTCGSEADLVAAQGWCRGNGVPFHVLGAGSNVLVSDLGVRGVVAALSVEAFGAIARRGADVVVGAACPLARLLGWCEARGLGGLERMAGIPGSVGGAMRMNAGAWDMTFGEQVAWIRSLKSDGRIAIVPDRDLGLAYRHCAAAADGVVLEVGLRLRAGDVDGLRAARREMTERRAWQRGLRSAGSVFRNPEGAYAGQLIDGAGLKGYGIGGARVLDRHANVIVAGTAATASDVLALMEHVRDVVRRRTGKELEREVHLLR